MNLQGAQVAELQRSGPSGGATTPAISEGHRPCRLFRNVEKRAATHIGSSLAFRCFRTGGKQYKVAKDDVIAVEKLAGEPGAVIELGEVLMIGEGAEVTTGTPLRAGASFAATVVDQTRAPKIIVFKKQRRKNYRRKKGHRQEQTVLRIAEIRSAGGPPGVTDGA